MSGKDALRPAERAAVAEEIASVLRHDLRNRFAAIRNAAYFIRRRLGQTTAELDPRVERFFELIEGEVQSASRLVDDGMSLTHLFARRVTRLDPGACVRQAVDAARLAQGGGVRIELDVVDSEVEADPDELALAVRCLLENALEATAGGDEGVQVSGRVSEGRYDIEVSDPGATPEPAQLAGAATAFTSTKPGHSGLGFNIARRTFLRYRGELRLERRGDRTVAAAWLPVATAGECGGGTT